MRKRLPVLRIRPTGLEEEIEEELTNEEIYDYRKHQCKRRRCTNHWGVNGSADFPAFFGFPPSSPWLLDFPSAAAFFLPPPRPTIHCQFLLTLSQMNLLLHAWLFHEDQLVFPPSFSFLSLFITHVHFSPRRTTRDLLRMPGTHRARTHQIETISKPNQLENNRQIKKKKYFFLNTLMCPQCLTSISWEANWLPSRSDKSVSCWISGASLGRLTIATTSPDALQTRASQGGVSVNSTVFEETTLACASRVKMPTRFLTTVMT